MSQRTNTITINVDHRALDHLGELVQRHKPLLSRHRAAWAALNLGLEVLDAEPELLVEFLEREKTCITAQQPLDHAARRT